MMSAPDISLILVKFDWNSVDSVLMSTECIITLPEMYIVTCGKLRSNVSAANFFSIKQLHD